MLRLPIFRKILACWKGPIFLSFAVLSDYRVGPSARSRPHPRIYARRVSVGSMKPSKPHQALSIRFLTNRRVVARFRRSSFPRGPFGSASLTVAPLLCPHPTGRRRRSSLSSSRTPTPSGLPCGRHSAISSVRGPAARASQCRRRPVQPHRTLELPPRTFRLTIRWFDVNWRAVGPSACAPRTRRRSTWSGDNAPQQTYALLSYCLRLICRRVARNVSRVCHISSVRRIAAGI